METKLCLVGEECEKYLGVKLMGCLVSFILLSSNTLLSPRDKNMSVLEKGVGTLNPHCMFAPVVKYLDI